MQFLKSFLVEIFLVSIFLIPLWIYGIPKASWSITMKKMVIAAMMAISMIFTILGFIKPNPHFLTRIIGDILTVLYLFVVFVSAYYSWIKLK